MIVQFDEQEIQEKLDRQQCREGSDHENPVAHRKQLQTKGMELDSLLAALDNLGEALGTLKLNLASKPSDIGCPLGTSCSVSEPWEIMESNKQ